MGGIHITLCIPLILCLIAGNYAATSPNDLKVLNDFRKALENPELLKWPENGDDPCGQPPWPYIYCSGDRVTQIQTKQLNLRGSLPPNFNQLSELSNLGLQGNKLTGNLPTFRGLSKLEFAFLNGNEFNAIPSDFFNGLNSLRVLALDNNPLNASTGWSFPVDLQKSTQLTNLSLSGCNLVGELPDFLGTLASLTTLELSFNGLSGGIPATFGQSSLQILWLNNQRGGGMTGPIDVVVSMTSLTQLWLHGNQFTGTIPASIGNLTSLKEINLNRNQLVGLIPETLASMELTKLDLSNNQLMGPIPNFKSGNVTYDYNSFCQPEPGLPCAFEVTALLDFLGNLHYPSILTSKWSGNEPCAGPWFGLSCNRKDQVSIINLPRYRLNGTLSPSLAKLDSLLEIRLGGNNITGIIPNNLTELKSLRLLDLGDDNIQPPLPKFDDSVKVITEGNPLLFNTTGSNPPPTSSLPPSGSQSPPQNNSNRFKRVAIVVGVSVFSLVTLSVIVLLICCLKRKKAFLQAPSSIELHPPNSCDPENVIKIAVSDNATRSLSTNARTSSLNNISETDNSHTIEAGNLVISLQVLRKVTKDFSKENELGRGGFGTVYMGELEDGTKLAVKRMADGATSSKGMKEFQAEIAVLSKVRHRNLVSLLGYSIEDNERLLVYEYMPLGALSMHLFHWKDMKLEPLSWSQRLTIALDVGRGMEYLHGLARQTFIHRDLKSSNILLDADFRAKISDFGLVKLAPDGEKSMITKLAGTFGYLAPEYAVMGKITTKVDVFSYGVVLIELLTGQMALDESRPEESQYLVEWFRRIKSNKEKLMAAIDPALEANEQISDSVAIVAELAGHCTSREPNHRPDISHAVNVLAALVENWRPIYDEPDCYNGIDFSRPLLQMLNGWKEGGSKEFSYNNSLQDSKGSIPTRPSGFADSFTSSDAR